MKALAAAVMFLAATLTANADTFNDDKGDRWTIAKPPLIYLTRQYKGELIVYWWTKKEVADICEGLTGLAEQFACVTVWAARCEIYMIKDFPEYANRALMEHELAHCNGWGADHWED
jgi:hypothetical protein